MFSTARHQYHISLFGPRPLFANFTNTFLLINDCALCCGAKQITVAQTQIDSDVLARREVGVSP